MKRLIIFCTCLILVAGVWAADPYAGIATPDPLGDPGTNSVTLPLGFVLDQPTNAARQAEWNKQMAEKRPMNIGHKTWQKMKDQERATQLQREQIAANEEIAKIRGKTQTSIPQSQNKTVRQGFIESPKIKDWSAEEAKTTAFMAEQEAIRARQRATEAERMQQKDDFYANSESDRGMREIKAQKARIEVEETRNAASRAEQEAWSARQQANTVQAESETIGSSQPKDRNGWVDW